MGCTVKVSFRYYYYDHLKTAVTCNKAGICNYWYDQVPKSSNQTNCSTRTGDSIVLSCAVYHPCDNISIDWYRSVAEGEGDIQDRGERINASSKYTLIPLTGTNVVTINGAFDNTCCFTSSILVIDQFSEDEAGYYWCQIVTPNGRLQNSPYAFISLHREMVANPQTCTVGDYINHLNPPICGTNRTYIYFSTSERRSCNSTGTETFTTTTTALRTTHLLDSTIHSSSLTNSTYETLHSTTTSNFISTTRGSVTPVTTSQFPWVYLLLTGVIAVQFVAMFIFIILCCRYRALWKRGESIDIICGE